MPDENLAVGLQEQSPIATHGSFVEPADAVVVRNKFGQLRCEHDRVRYRCWECGGTGTCEHNRVRTDCRECGGSRICEHGRVRHWCRECHGAGICDHGRRRCLCAECGGSGVCEHGRQRQQCPECGGRSICEHGRQRLKCVECGGYKTWATRLVTAAKTRAKTNNLPFDLTVEWAEEQLKKGCPVFNRPFERGMGSGWRHDWSATIDKFEPALGYVMSNCAVISWLANRIKTDANADQVSRVAAWMNEMVEAKNKAVGA
jgi:hypothetical protein